MANIIYINDLRSNRDSDFTKTPIGYVANDSTSRPILGLGDKLELDVPPLTSGDFGNIRASIEGTNEFSDIESSENKQFIITIRMLIKDKYNIMLIQILLILFNLFLKITIILL